MKGDTVVSITIKTDSKALNIPVIPPKVTVSYGSSTPKTVNVWGKGEVDFNNGKDLDSLGLSSFFPSRYDPSYCSVEPKEIQWYIDTLNGWKNKGTVLQVVIPEMGINQKMKIKSFQGDFEGQELDFYYDLEFKEYVKLPQVKVEAKKYITIKKRDPKPVKKKATSQKTKKKVAIKKGDKVQFKGGPVYISSMASKPAVKRGKAKCNCTIVNGNAHPYHLIHYSGDMVYGWVNASDCEKI